MLLSRRWSARATISLVVISCWAAGCATATSDGETVDDETMGDGDLATGGAGDGDGDGDGTGGLVVVPGSGGGLVGSGGAASGGSNSGGSASGGDSGTGGVGSGGAGSGGNASGGASSGGAGSGGAPSGEMCDAAPWAAGPQGTYEPGDHVTAICPDSGLQNGHECYGHSGKYWFFCEGDNYQCSTFDPSGNVAHGVWQISASPCP